MNELIHQELLANREIELVDSRSLQQLVRLLEVAHDMASDLYERAGPRNGHLWKERMSAMDQLESDIEQAKWTANAVLKAWAVEDDD